MTSLSPPLSSTLLLLWGPLPVLRRPGHTCPSRHERKPPANCCHCNVFLRVQTVIISIIILDNLKSTGKVDFLFKEIKGPPIARILQYLICIKLNQHIITNIYCTYIYVLYYMILYDYMTLIINVCCVLCMLHDIKLYVSNIIYMPVHPNKPWRLRLDTGGDFLSSHLDEIVRNGLGTAKSQHMLETALAVDPCHNVFLGLEQPQKLLFRVSHTLHFNTEKRCARGNHYAKHAEDLQFGYAWYILN